MTFVKLIQRRKVKKMKVDNVNLVVSAVRRSQYPDDELPEFIMLGRSNVGKSSFLNTLVNRKN